MAADDGKETNKETTKEINTVQQETRSKNPKRKIDGNLLMSFAAIFLSAGTLFILIYQSNLISKQFELQQRQQFASAMPYLLLGLSNDGSNIKFVLANQGLGPAFVEVVRVHYKDTIFENSDLASAHYHLGKMDKNINELYSYSNIFPGLLVSPQEKIEHLNLELSEDIKYDLLTNGDAELEIEYRSIYHERWRIKGVFGIPEKIESERLLD